MIAAEAAEATVVVEAAAEADSHFKFRPFGAMIIHPVGPLRPTGFLFGSKPAHTVSISVHPAQRLIQTLSGLFSKLISTFAMPKSVRPNIISPKQNNHEEHPLPLVAWFARSFL